MFTGTLNACVRLDKIYAFSAYINYNNKFHYEIFITYRIFQMFSLC